MRLGNQRFARSFLPDALVPPGRKRRVNDGGQRWPQSAPRAPRHGRHGPPPCRTATQPPREVGSFSFGYRTIFSPLPPPAPRLSRRPEDWFPIGCWRWKELPEQFRTSLGGARMPVGQGQDAALQPDAALYVDSHAPRGGRTTAIRLVLSAVQAQQPVVIEWHVAIPGIDGGATTQAPVRLFLRAFCVHIIPSFCRPERPECRTVRPVPLAEPLGLSSQTGRRGTGAICSLRQTHGSVAQSKVSKGMNRHFGSLFLST